MEAHETLKFPHFLDNRLTDGGKVVSPTGRPPFILTNIPSSPFCYRLSRPQGYGVAGRFRQIEKNPPHRDTIPRPSGLQHSASTHRVLPIRGYRQNSSGFGSQRTLLIRDTNQAVVQRRSTHVPLRLLAPHT
jgi:hypothetical protein